MKNNFESQDFCQNHKTMYLNCLLKHSTNRYLAKHATKPLYLHDILSYKKLTFRKT